MTDPRRAIKDFLFNHLLEDREFTLGPSDLDLAVMENSDAGRVVTPIFQSLEAFCENASSTCLPDVSNDSAHENTVVCRGRLNASLSSIIGELT